MLPQRSAGALSVKDAKKFPGLDRQEEERARKSSSQPTSQRSARPSSHRELPSQHCPFEGSCAWVTSWEEAFFSHPLGFHPENLSSDGSSGSQPGAILLHPSNIC